MVMNMVARDIAARKRIGVKVVQKTGFTIVETMIVLAVTGGLFVIIAATLSGRQNKAEFNHAIQDVQQRLQQTIDQVSLGYYPNNNDFACSDSGGSVNIGPGTNQQGTNDQCIFIGKVIQFGVFNTSPEQYQIFSLAGLRCASPYTGDGCPDGSPSVFHAPKPTVIVNAGNYTQDSTTGTLQYGLSTVWIRSFHNSGCTSSICSLGAVAFMTEPGSLNANSLNGYNNGKQLVDLVPVINTKLGQNYATAVSRINNSLDVANLDTAGPINPTSGVQLCFLSGGTNQSGLITIGGSGRQLSVKLDIKNSNNCT